MKTRLFLLLPLLCIFCPSAYAVVTYDLPVTGGITGTGRVYGQTFTVPASDPILDYFTVRVESRFSPATSFEFKIAEWDDANSVVVGSPLYTSVTQTAHSGLTDFTFTANLSLVPGGKYVAFIDSTGYAFNNGLNIGGTGSDLYTGGAFAYPPFTTSQPWTVYTDGTDLSFAARFVPEPNSVAALAAFFGLILSRRTLHRGAT